MTPPTTRMTRKTRIDPLGVAERTLILAIAAGAFNGACAPPGCDISGLLRQQAGGGARDCGYATHPAAPSSATDAGATRPDGGRRDAGAPDAGKGSSSSVEAVDACVVDAFTDNKAFYAEYDRPDVGPGVVSGIAGDGTGRVWLLIYTPRSGYTAHSGDGSAVIDACNSPSLDTSGDRDPNLTPPIHCRSTNAIGAYCGGGSR